MTAGSASTPLKGKAELNGNAHRVLRVGIIGCGEISQVAHIPNINNMSHRFVTTFLCDVSEEALAYCASRIVPKSPRTTKNAEELCASQDVDVVLIASANAFHVPHAILALKYNKYCLLEKPAALNYRDADSLLEAESLSKGKVFVGYMRRYAPAFLEAVKEVGGMKAIQYARVRDIIGPNSVFVDQSCIYPRKFRDICKADTDDLAIRDDEIIEHALSTEFGAEVTPQSKRMLRLLGGRVEPYLLAYMAKSSNLGRRLGTHDLSAMREILGMPQSCLGASLGFPGIWSALFQYNGFAVAYESGINDIPIFDAFIEVFSETKSVKITYDTPYIKGLPITMTIREKVAGRPGSDSYGFEERTVRRTYEDAYTLEFETFYQCVINQTEPKTSVSDARQDLDVIRMILKTGEGNYNR
jgi:predicted dehydrogenase